MPLALISFPEFFFVCNSCGGLQRHSLRQLWGLMEQASKRALSPASVATEVNGAADGLPQETLEVAVQTTSILPLLEEDLRCACAIVGC